MLLKELLQEDKKKPEFVLVIGGAGSGKNYSIETDSKLNKYHLVDVDAMKKDMGLDLAIKQVKTNLQDAFEKGLNVVHPTTGSNLKGQINKIELAKKYGYKVILLLKDTPIEQAIANVQKRVAKGGHGVLEKDIVASNEKARQNFETLGHLVDAHRKI